MERDERGRKVQYHRMRGKLKRRPPKYFRIVRPVTGFSSRDMSWHVSIGSPRTGSGRECLMLKHVSSTMLADSTVGPASLCDGPRISFWLLRGASRSGSRWLHGLHAARLCYMLAATGKRHFVLTIS